MFEKLVCFSVWFLSIVCWYMSVQAIKTATVQKAKGSATVIAPKKKRQIISEPDELRPHRIAFEQIWNLPLQKPLFDPPPPPQPETKPVVLKSKPAFQANLIGTMVDQNYSVAIFALETGNIQAVSEGESLTNGAKIVEIRNENVKIEYDGRQLTLELDHEKSL